MLSFIDYMPVVRLARGLCAERVAAWPMDMDKVYSSYGYERGRTLV